MGTRLLNQLVASTVIAAVALAVAHGPIRAQEHTPVVDAPAAELRVGLGRLLAEHAFLTIEGMRTGVAEGDAFAAAGAALEDNTQELVDTIGSLYGAAAGEAFGEQWRAHIGYVVDYTRAVAEDDAAGQETARERLSAFATSFAELLASVTELPTAAVEALLEDHIGQLEQVAAFAAGDYADAYPAMRETYAHMYTIGSGLAAAIAPQFPDRFSGAETMASPAVDLRVRLESALGEHAFLAVLATRAALTGAPDAEPAMAALNANSEALQGAIAAIYGGDAGRAFRELWDDHVANYVAYVEATAADDDDGREAARAALGEYGEAFSAFLASANPGLAAADLEAMLGDHVEHLLDQVDAYAAEDYEASYALAREAYAHMGELSAALAAAIAAQFPLIYPDTALALETPSPADPRPIVGGLLVAAAVLIGVRRMIGRTRG